MNCGGAEAQVAPDLEEAVGKCGVRAAHCAVEVGLVGNQDEGEGGVAGDLGGGEEGGEGGRGEWRRGVAGGKEGPAGLERRAKGVPDGYAAVGCGIWGRWVGVEGVVDDSSLLKQLSGGALLAIGPK